MCGLGSNLTFLKFKDSVGAECPVQEEIRSPMTYN